MHLIHSEQFDREALDKFFLSCDSEVYGGGGAEKKVLATLFLEPSTRTRLSFEAAMYRLKGNVITAADPTTSSIAKGETVDDMVQTVSNYADVIVLRSPVKGSVLSAAKGSYCPVINAGDGAGEHPTQALLDLYTIRKRHKLDRLRVAICGDLLHGRTVHSLVRLLSQYQKLTLLLTSPSRLSLPDELTEQLKAKRVELLWCRSIAGAIAERPHVVYMTRLQKERMVDYAIHEDRWKDFCITKEQVGLLPEDSLLMHPMPRNEEIPVEVDYDKRSMYLKHQPRNGVLVRQTLIYSIVRGKVPYSIL